MSTFVVFALLLLCGRDMVLHYIAANHRVLGDKNLSVMTIPPMFIIFSLTRLFLLLRKCITETMKIEKAAMRY